MIWFTSDTHVNHFNIIRLSRRPFHSAQEMNEHIISKWNEKVRPEDTIYHLGDVMYPETDESHLTADEFMSQLNGDKHLILGNHDLERYKGTNVPLVKDHPGWSSVSTYKEIYFGKSRFVACHYPLETWRNAHRGWYHVHGHCHGTLKRVIPHRLDVGVDCVKDYAPISAEELRDIFKSQTNYLPQDHHGD